MFIVGWLIVVLTLVSGAALLAVFGFGTALMLITHFGVSIQQIVPMAVGMVNSWPLLAMPLFLLSGNLMVEGELARQLIGLMSSLFRQFRAGLMIATIAFCTVFAAISGSGYAGISAVGTIMMPEMKKAGYPDSLSSAAIAVSGEMGILIPPSLFFIIWGMLTVTSAAALFAAGLIPGLILAAIYIVVGVIGSRRAKVPALPAASWKERRTSFVTAIPALIMPIIILGGIYSGRFTPTEAAAISSGYAVLIGVLVYRKLRWKTFKKALHATADTSAVMYTIMASIGIFAYLINISNVGPTIADFVVGLGLSRTAFITVLFMVFVALGFIIDPWTLCFILVPTLMPTFKAMGIDLVYAGVLFCLGTMIGEMTPPNAFGLYVAAKICKVKPTTTIRGVWVFLGAEVAFSLVVIFVPDIALWLPRTLGLLTG